MNKESHEIVELLFSKLLQFLAENSLQKTHAEVAHYVDVGEYGLAFEAALDGCVEWGYAVPDEVRKVFEEMAGIMEIGNSVLEMLPKRA